MEKKTTNQSDIEKLAELITTSRHCVAFTGAGVSTLSGIQDFRGKNGLYQTINADDMFDIRKFRQDPSVYYSLSKDFIYGLDEKEPSTVHCVLAKLEQAGFLNAIITQNVDLLHQKAGSKNVIEIHGTPATHRCLDCSFIMPFPEVTSIVRTGAVPRCPKCGGSIKPDITFFGESLPQQALADADRNARTADLMIILGTSLVVQPAASLPGMTLRAGGKIVLVNDMPTPLDEYATLRFSDLQTTFEALEKALFQK
ncbi:MAG TPA: NAD-dependent protein deacylase [Treponema sp.]|nr:NAD-dependent protein deacylase [Treponema sp.]